MDQWTPEEITAHIEFMSRLAEELRERGEYVDERAGDRAEAARRYAAAAQAASSMAEKTHLLEQAARLHRSGPAGS
jgi:hypothetical protein